MGADEAVEQTSGRADAGRKGADSRADGRKRRGQGPARANGRTSDRADGQTGRSGLEKPRSSGRGVH